MQTGLTERAVVLLNLGGPPTLGDIREFLFDLFMDREIIPIPIEGVVRRPLAGLLARLRARRVVARYGAIGGGSPLVKITARQAQALQETLSRDSGVTPVFSVMRYGHPSAAEVLGTLPSRPRRFIGLPLFPQYCRATTATAVKEFTRHLAVIHPQASFTSIDHFWDHPGFVGVMSRRIGAAIDKAAAASGVNPFVLFSAHGVPRRFVRDGDPYVEQIERHCDLLAARCKLQPGQWSLAYQSKIGPVEWVGPSSVDVVRDVARRGSQALVVVPVSFVSDHLETLHDLDIELKGTAKEAGIAVFERVACPNDDPDFIAVLAELVAANDPGFPPA